jgi:hypothetical protein
MIVEDSVDESIDEFVKFLGRELLMITMALIVEI